MELWCCSEISLQRLEGLVRHGLLCAWTVVSFALFHERGFTTPTHRFLRGLLHYYKIELQHLNPNGIQRMVAFVALCEGFLGISPHFELWQHFFAITLQKKREKR